MKVRFDIRTFEHVIMWRRYREVQSWELEVDMESHVWRDGDGDIAFPREEMQRMIEWGFYAVDPSVREELTLSAARRQSCELRVLDPFVKLYPFGNKKGPARDTTNRAGVHLYRFPDGALRGAELLIVDGRKIIGRRWNEKVFVPRFPKVGASFTLDVPETYAQNPAPICEMVQRSRFGTPIDGYGAFYISRWRIVY